ncbi:MAG: hypothetical protein HDR27_08380 [Lachnospiraceae bacterium]|nr:hypothetical protein [Lachnospiraceae bacterium]
MAVTGIGQGNAAIYNPFQRGRNYRGNEAPEFNEALYGSGAVEQDMQKTFRSQDIDPLSVDPRNASYEEIQALNDHLVGKGWLKEEDLDSFEHPTKDDTQRADYLSALRKWRDTQYQAGNMVGYRNAAKVCDAWSNVALEKDGKVQEVGGSRVYAKEGRMTSGIIGFGTLDDGTTYSASYASGSTVGNPVIEIRMQRKGGKEELYMVSPRKVDPANASQLEMFALCAYADSQGITGTSTGNNSYQKLLSYARYGGIGDSRAKTADAFMGRQQDWSSFVTDSRIEKLDLEGKVDASWGKTLQNLFGKLKQQNIDQEKVEGRSESELWFQAVADTLPEDNGVPYYYLAKDGIIDYNGVVFFCDEERKALCLGDVSDKSKCLNIPLSGGGCLIVNRDNLGSLAKAIGMFSPEDVNLIMRAIAEDAKIQQMKQQIEDETSGLDLAEETGGDGTEEAEETEETGEMAVAGSVAGEEKKEEKRA